MSVRKMGKGAIFADLWDRTGRLQLYVRKDALGDEPSRVRRARSRRRRRRDRHVFRSKMGELTLRVASFEPLRRRSSRCPTSGTACRRREALPPALRRPDREPHVRATIFMRARRSSPRCAASATPRASSKCETPTMLHVAGGAAARPFRTHHNALDIDLDLRIATELNLKRLIVGGLERVYEIGRIFRNEGIDTTHNPEFTMLELYAAYWSVHEMMEFNEELFAHLVQSCTAATLVVRRKRSRSRGPSSASPTSTRSRVRRLRARDAARSGRRAARARRPRSAASPTHGQALDKIFERVVEPHLVDPTFVYDYPVVISPLAKRKAGDPEIVDRYELFGANFELSNAFTELNDPDDQRARFERRSPSGAGDDEVPPPDWDFVHALEYGMPPTAGIGIGVDRLVMLLTNQQSIREVILFPLQRPLGERP
jgi:lysyl-tRNA synthetase class 2